MDTTMKKDDNKDPPNSSDEKGDLKNKLRSSRSIELSENLSPKTRRRSLQPQNKAPWNFEANNAEVKNTENINETREVSEHSKRKEEIVQNINEEMAAKKLQMNLELKTGEASCPSIKDEDDTNSKNEITESPNCAIYRDLENDLHSGNIKVEEQSDDSTTESKISRERRKTKSKYSNLETDDLEKMLKWKNGIGHLAGSNLKFRKSDLGDLEVITPSSDEEEDNCANADIDNEIKEQTDGRVKRKRGPRRYSDNYEPAKPTSPKQKKVELLQDLDLKKKRKDKKKKFAEDELLKCETCGCYGLISEFRSSGRFCSQRCVGAYASKRRAEMIAEQFASGERPLPKSARKPSIKKRKSVVRNIQARSPSVTKQASSPRTIDTGVKSTVKDDSTIYFEAVGYDVTFNWKHYMKTTNSEAVDESVFIREYPEQSLYPPSCSTVFQPSMKLECADPKHQSHICVVSIVEVQGARMRLHFDGWSESYDFWINCDSPFLHPCGWCEKNGQRLTPPRGMTSATFHWSQYLFDTGCEAAPSEAFPKVSQTRHRFTTNMKLEAVDRKNPDLICVASVNNVIGNHFLIHFDEWDDQYDYWCKDDTPFIHPVGWCQEKQVPLVPPTDDMVNKFDWSDYLKETNSIAAPNNIFKQMIRQDFKVGSKLEVIDPRNPSLARVGTVAETEDYRVKVHFDGWDKIYDYWFDYDSTDLHPIDWCKKTGHPLESPPVGAAMDDSRLCGTPGCRGIGHIKGLKYTTHHTSFGCPYTPHNINRSTQPVVDRLAPNAIAEETSISNRIYKKKFGSPIVDDALPDSTTADEKQKPRQRMSGRPAKKNHRLLEETPTPPARRGRGGFRRRKRRRSDEVTSSTSPPANINTPHSNSYLTKPIPSTHRPAGRANLKYQQQTQVLISKAMPWSPDDVVEFLKGIGYEDLAPSFKNCQIDGQALLLLSQADLVHHMKLKLGPALKIYSEISKL